MPRPSIRSIVAFALFISVSLRNISAADSAEWLVGVSKVDITPEQPIRLSGYGNRRTESDGIAQRLWAKAIAISSDSSPPAVLVAIDNCGVPAHVTEEVALRLLKSTQLSRERFVVCSTHTHTGPCLTGILPNLFSTDIPADQQTTIDSYTRKLADLIEKAALEALNARKPSRLDWAEGIANFARNRRTSGGPIDPALPVLRITDPDGTVRGVLANYACHATTLVGEFNKSHGDWPGYAQESLEREFPGAIALMIVGCGADANPHPRGQVEHARQHGEEITREVGRIFSKPLQSLSETLNCRFKRIELPFSTLPSRDEWEVRAKRPGIVGYHARVNLARLDRGETLPRTLPYPIQVWNFGDQLALVFLAGEVVVDYALRLKSEYQQVWITAYANDVPCYIPSRRVLSEGGYEAEDSLWYYDRPARLAPETEERIHNTLAQLVPNTFLINPDKAEFPPPKSPEESMATILTRPGLRVELVAAEPDVVDPVAIDFGADGRLWVVEMRDFPSGIDGNWQPGGRVKVLEDNDGDGRFETSRLFLDGIPFPTGIIADENDHSVVLLKSGGAKEAIQRKEIVAIRASEMSLMPEGFELAMTAQEMADLMSYLQRGLDTE